VDGIEHGSSLSTETLAMMKTRGTYLVPTLVGALSLVQMARNANDRVALKKLEELSSGGPTTVAAAHKLGIRIIASTDGNYTTPPGSTMPLAMPLEIAELVKVGLSPMAAIQAATSAAAEGLRISGRTGSIRVGLEADLVAVEGNPLNDVKCLQNIVLVVNNGSVIVQKLSPQ
jgi:imidazolonepropionase-like amidohydrolase